jgi:hypothetical protein
MATGRRWPLLSLDSETHVSASRPGKRSMRFALWCECWDHLPLCWLISFTLFERNFLHVANTMSMTRLKHHGYSHTPSIAYTLPIQYGISIHPTPHPRHRFRNRLGLYVPRVVHVSSLSPSLVSVSLCDVLLKTPRVRNMACLTTALLLPYDRIRKIYVNAYTAHICTTGRQHNATFPRRPGQAKKRKETQRLTLNTINAQNTPTSRHRCAYWMLNMR